MAVLAAVGRAAVIQSSLEGFQGEASIIKCCVC